MTTTGTLEFDPLDLGEGRILLIKRPLSIEELRQVKDLGEEAGRILKGRDPTALTLDEAERVIDLIRRILEVVLVTPELIATMDLHDIHKVLEHIDRPPLGDIQKGN